MKTNKVHISQIPQMEFRFDPPLHLSEGVKVRSTLNRLPFENKPLLSVAEKIFLGNIFSRIWVKDKTHGIPYLSASDTVLANLDTGQFLAKRQGTEMPYLMLKPDWILVTCSGTLGKTTYTNNNFNGRIATHDLIRIIPNQDKMPGGYIYAFLSGKYGYYQITQSQFGGVVKHVNATQAGQISIPELPKDFQDKIDGIIKESARLREEAANALKNAQNIATAFISFGKPSENKGINISNITSSHNKRMEASYYVSRNRNIYDIIIERPHKLLGEITEKIFRPGIFKRKYVDNGITFLGGADILLSIPNSDKKLSERQVNQMPVLRVKKDWLLLTCGGTIGRLVYIDEQLSKCVISQHVMRIVPKDNSEILFAFLSSPIGEKLINMFTYGSVIPSVENHHLELLPIPIYSEEKTKEIKSNVIEYVSKTYKAKTLELEAISLVEAEIEKLTKE